MVLAFPHLLTASPGTKSESCDLPLDTLSCPLGRGEAVEALVFGQASERLNSPSHRGYLGDGEIGLAWPYGQSWSDVLIGSWTTRYFEVNLPNSRSGQRRVFV